MQMKWLYLGIGRLFLLLFRVLRILRTGMEQLSQLLSEGQIEHRHGFNMAGTDIYIYIYILKTVCNKIVPMLALGRRALNTTE